jgi:MarR family transcriptional regulator, organic hydroperoxide resistance regulator
MTQEGMIVEEECAVGARKEQVLEDIFNNLRRVFQAVQEYSKRVERETGLTGPQAWTMRVIADNGPIRITDIAQRMYLHVATVVGIVDRLEARGLVSRTRGVQDRRVVRVELTKEGRSLVANAPQVAQGMLLFGLEMLPDRKLRTIQSGLDTMVRILNAQNIPPKMLLSEEVNASPASLETLR